MHIVNLRLSQKHLLNNLAARSTMEILFFYFCSTAPHPLSPLVALPPISSCSALCCLQPSAALATFIPMAFALLLCPRAHFNFHSHCNPRKISNHCILHPNHHVIHSMDRVQCSMSAITTTPLLFVMSKL